SEARKASRAMECPAGKPQIGTGDGPAGRSARSRWRESPALRSTAGPHPPADGAAKGMALPGSRFRDCPAENHGPLEMMEGMTRIILLLIPVLSLALTGCGEKVAATKRYAIEGEVKALDANTKTAT